MSEIAILEILLHDQHIATLTHLPGDRNVLSFKEEYIADAGRPTLSLSFKDPMGDLITNVPTTRTRLPPFFANLLPEGHMREYLASQAKINPQREFYLLAALGKDLPGALTVRAINNTHLGVERNEPMEEVLNLEKNKAVLRFLWQEYNSNFRLSGKMRKD